MAKDANDYGNTSASGYGAYGHGSPWSHQYVEPPTFGGMSPENAESVFGGDSFAEAPRQILEDGGSSVVLPFQPQFTYIGSNWYMSFKTTGVVFLPIARDDTDHKFHLPWNSAWPFRPVIESDVTVGSPLDGSSRHRFINDAATYSNANGGTRRPVLKLANDSNNIIYLEVTYNVEDEPVTAHPDGSSETSYSGIPAKVPAMKLTGLPSQTEQDGAHSHTGHSNDGHSHDIDPNDGHNHDIDFSNATTHHEIDDLNAPFQPTDESSFGGEPHVYVPLQEKNYYVEVPEQNSNDGSYDLTQWNVRVKVASSADSDNASDVFSSKYTTWRNEELTRKFVWGAVVVDDESPPVITSSEWWRYDCPNYDINNHVMGKTTSLNPDKQRNIPVIHVDADNAETFKSAQAPVDGISTTI